MFDNELIETIENLIELMGVRLAIKKVSEKHKISEEKLWDLFDESQIKRIRGY